MVVSFDGFRDLFSRFHGHRALVNDHSIIGQHARNFPGNFLHKTEIDVAIWQRRGRDGDENNLRVFDGFLNAAGETQPARRDVAVNDFFESRFVDRYLTGLQLFHFFGVVIDADHMMADIGETGACHQTNVSGADN